MDAGEPLLDVDVRVAQDADALLLEEGGAFGVVSFLRGMAVAVDFDDKLQFSTVEIGDVGTDGLLTQEFVAVELAVAQELLPDRRFGRGGGLAVGAGEVGQSLVVGNVFGVR